MAHAAEIDPETREVLRVIVVPDAHEHRIQDFCALDLGLGGTWIQTSYNANMRGKFAGIGDFYDAELDIFTSPQPYPSWSLQADGTWSAPVPYPDDGAEYTWDEQGQAWVVV